MKNNFKKYFPLLSKNNLTYLDSAATTQKPRQVLKKLDYFYKHSNANAHHGIYKLSEDASAAYDSARQKVANFIGANNNYSIIFTKSATESINLVANSFGLSQIKKGDKIVLSIMEHHSNLVPWQMASKKQKAKLEYLFIDKNYQIPKQELSKIDSSTKLVAITLQSNVLGTITNIKPIIKKAHSVGALVLLDATQFIVHNQLLVAELDADFVVFSAHKIYAPLGVGVLCGKTKILEQMPPFLLGGNMIEYVTEQNTTFAPLPQKFEAGTQNVAAAVGLGYAIDFINSIGYKTIMEHEQQLTDYAIANLKQLPYIDLYLPTKSNMHRSVISFNMLGVHSHDVASFLASKNICVRSGSHCAQPLLDYLHLQSTVRISFGIYNTKKDIDNLVEALKYTYSKFSKYIGESHE